MNSHDAKVVAEFLAGAMQQEISITESVFNALPLQTLDYRPDAKSRTAIELVRHITVEDEWLLNCVANGVVTPPPDAEQSGIGSPAEAVVQYKARIPAALARIRACSGEQLAADVDFLGMGKMPLTQILGMTLSHSAHHRGQLSAYIRAMGGKVPNIYGPSADTMAAVAH